MPNPVQDYLVENSVGYYNNGYDDGVHGGVKIGASGTLYYEFQSAGVPASRVASNKSIMDQQEDITNFQSIFNGPYPFTSDGVIIGTPAASFEEEMETKITFAGGRISLGTFHHENMHQWWGDNVADEPDPLHVPQGGHGDARVVAGDGADGGEQCRRLRYPGR